MKSLRLAFFAFFSLVLLTACASDHVNQENAMGQVGEPMPETNLLDQY